MHKGRVREESTRDLSAARIATKHSGGGDAVVPVLAGKGLKTTRGGPFSPPKKLCLFCAHGR